MSKISYTYDERNRLTSVTFETGQKLVYGYDSAGNLTSSTVTLGAPVRLVLEQTRPQKMPSQAPAQPSSPPSPAAQAPSFTIPPRPVEKAGLSRAPAQVEPKPAQAEPVPTCSRCQSQLRPGARFCGACGAAVSQAVPAAQSCPQCGKPIQAETRFCKNCGFKLKS
jgi:YD repeat-containing protein